MSEMILLDGSRMGAHATWPLKSGVERFVLHSASNLTFTTYNVDRLSF